MGRPLLVKFSPNKEFMVLGYCTFNYFGLSKVEYGLILGPRTNVIKKIGAVKSGMVAKDTGCGAVARAWQNRELEISWPEIIDSHPDADEYKIDRLNLRVYRDVDSECVSGDKLTTLLINGAIGPDSSFAVERLLEKENSCDTKDTKNDMVVILNSGGGFLEHGYKLGEVFRKYRVTALVSNDNECASSCAVAFLGARRRNIAKSGRLLFHSPYYMGKNELGKTIVACAEDEETLSKMRQYYQEMLGQREGEVLFERTMSYCSQNDGWVITGNSAGELYGITHPWPEVIKY
jgi:ATP-dependent protease ClpP protease subunit